MNGIHASGTRKHKRDANHSPIARRLEALGASVFDLSSVGRGLSDLLVGFCKRTYLVEIKTADGELTPAQVTFAATWRGAPPVEVRSEKEAEAWYLRTRSELCREPRRPAAGFVGLLVAAIVLATSFVAAQTVAAHMPDAIEARR